MKKIAFAMALTLLAGCVSRKSVSNKPVFQELIGQHYRTTKELFLVDNMDYFTLEAEGRSQTGPSFDQFRNGEWKNRWTRPAKYLSILPEGTILETTDVLRQDHVEMGRTWEIHGIIVEPAQFSEVGPVYMCYFTTFDNLMWQPGLERINTKPSAGENASRHTP
jgi:hypothetical protein